MRLTIGPDDYAPGTAWHLNDEESGGVASGGTSGRPRDGSTPDGWLRWARGQRDLVDALRKVGLQIDEGDVRPFGWSEGPGHAPNGIIIEWEVGS